MADGNSARQISASWQVKVEGAQVRARGNALGTPLGKVDEGTDRQGIHSQRMRSTVAMGQGAFEDDGGGCRKAHALGRSWIGGRGRTAARSSANERSCWLLHSGASSIGVRGDPAM